MLSLAVLLMRVIDAVNRHTGRAVAWLALAMVLVQFSLVLMRYVFGVGSVFVQESMIYMHGILFMMAAGYALLNDGHVRVDVFYREASPRQKAWINLIGVLVLMFPMCAYLAYVGWPYVTAAWAIREGSRETSGIPAIYLLKTVILVFVGLLAAQGLSLIIRSVLVLVGREDLLPPIEEEARQGGEEGTA